MNSSPYFSATALAASWPCWFQPKSVGSSGIRMAMLFTSAACAPATMPPRLSARSDTCASLLRVVFIARFLPVYFYPRVTPRMLRFGSNLSRSTFQRLAHGNQALGPQSPQFRDLLRRVAEDAAARFHAQLAGLGALGHVGAEVA